MPKKDEKQDSLNEKEIRIFLKVLDSLPISGKGIPDLRRYIQDIDNKK